MQDIQQAKITKKYTWKVVKESIWLALIMAYLCLCYYVPTLFGLTRHSECDMRTGYANAMFGMVLVGAHFYFRVAFLIRLMVKRCTTTNITALTEFVQTGIKIVVFVDIFIMLVGWATFFGGTQVLWTEIGSSPTCTQGRNLWDLINWLLILGITVWPTIITAILLLLSFFCGPGIIKAIKDYM